MDLAGILAALSCAGIWSGSPDHASGPTARVAMVAPDRIECLVDTGRTLLVTNVSGAIAPMTTYASLRRTTRRSDPRERLWVYGRARLPCRKCGTAIGVRKQGPEQRRTYWCPSCQRS